MQCLENKTDWEGGVVVEEPPGKTDNMWSVEEVWMSPNRFMDKPALWVVCARDAEEEDEEEDADSDFFYDDDDDDDLDDDLDDDFDDDDDFLADDDDL